MPKLSFEVEIERAISKLRSERAGLLSRVSEIDATFARLGIQATSAATAVAAKATTGKRRGRPPKAAKAGAKPGPKPGKKRRRGRGAYSQTAEEAVLEIVKSLGQPNSAEVNALWDKTGRSGRADNTLGKLVKDGKLSRIQKDGERGSRYALP